MNNENQQNEYWNEATIYENNNSNDSKNNVILESSILCG